MIISVLGVAPTASLPLPLHDALPIWRGRSSALPAALVTLLAMLRLGAEVAMFSARPSLMARRNVLRTSARRQQFKRSEEHTSELQSPCNLVYRLLLERKNYDISC